MVYVLSQADNLYRVQDNETASAIKMTPCRFLDLSSPGGVLVEFSDEKTKRIEAIESATLFLRKKGSESVIDSPFHVEKSTDDKKWEPLSLDYAAMELKVRERLDQILAGEEVSSSIPFLWLGDEFEFLTIFKRAVGLYILQMFGGLKEEWKTKCWEVFKKIGDDYWNTHGIKVDFYMQDSENTVTASFKQHTQEEIDQTVQENHSIYKTLLGAALVDYDELGPGEEIQMGKDSVFNCAASVYDWQRIDLAVATKLREKGAEVFRGDGKIHIKRPFEI